MNKNNPPRQRSRLRRAAGALLHALKVATVASIVVAAILAGLAWRTVKDTEFADRLQAVKAIQPSTVLAADGSELAVLRSVQREWVPLSRISPHVVHALIDTEDRRFYEHRGIDYARTLAAAFHTVHGETQGGSTLTQQLARNLYPQEVGRSRNISRKLREMAAAMHIEERYSKDEILEAYLNTVPFLYNVFGIEMAARTYYGKPAAELGPLEAATLVGMLKGTHYYNPVVNPGRARARRNLVLAQMVRQGHLGQEEYGLLADAPLGVRFQRPVETADSASHFVEYVRRWVADWAERNKRDLGAEGLVIQTTLDPKLQALATQAVERQAEMLQQVADVEWGQSASRLLSENPDAYRKMHPKVQPFRYFWSVHTELQDAFLRETPEYRKAAAEVGAEAALARLRRDTALLSRLRAAKTRLEAGFVALDPASAEVRAWVGSRDFQRDQYDHVAQAERQPGSTFKPFVYGAALERGLSPDKMYADAPVEIRLSDGKTWKPTDMGGPTGRAMSLREGLIYSKNSITAQVMRDIGVPGIASLARDAGINHSRLDPVPSLALGTSPVTLLEMAAGYATIARGGTYRAPVVVKRITDRNGVVIAEFGTQPVRVMAMNTAVELIDMMRGVVTRGTGQAMKRQYAVSADIAGKTGTTQNNTDGWFMLMHPNLVAGAWVGFNDARVTMRSSYWGQGGHNALHVVGDFMRQALDRNMLDGEAGFPKPARAPLLAAAPPRDPLEQPGIIITEDSPAAPSLLDETPPGPASGIVVRREGGRLWAGDSQAQAQPDGRAALSEEELGQVLSGMGRDPATGARMAARRAVETNTDEVDRMSGSSDGGGSTGSSGAAPDSLR